MGIQETRKKKRIFLQLQKVTSILNPENFETPKSTNRIYYLYIHVYCWHWCWGSHMDATLLVGADNSSLSPAITGHEGPRNGASEH